MKKRILSLIIVLMLCVMPCQAASNEKLMSMLLLSEYGMVTLDTASMSKLGIDPAQFDIDLGFSFCVYFGIGDCTIDCFAWRDDGGLTLAVPYTILFNKASPVPYSSKDAFFAFSEACGFDVCGFFTDEFACYCTDDLNAIKSLIARSDNRQVVFMKTAEQFRQYVEEKIIGN